MSSVPPNMPPGGGPPPPYPPYDPRTQWRVYREQQKAAWRAQRDAWKAQHYAQRNAIRAAYGPSVPSVVGPILLIGIGVIALLLLTGHIPAADFWAWYSRWWPLLLIAAGLGLLAEWALDMRRKTPVRRRNSSVGLLVLLAIIGIAAAGWHHAWGPFRNQFGDQGDNFFNFFGLPEHDNDAQALSQQIPANATIEIQNPRGDISIAAGDGQTIEVQAHEVAFANSDSDAKNIFNAEAPHLTVSGKSVLVKSDGNSSGRVNMTVTVPKNAAVTVNSGWDDVTAAGLGAGINVTARGDIQLSSIVGPVEAHFTRGRHDIFSAHDIQGDVTLDGPVDDLTISEIKGRLTQNGDIQGDVRLGGITGPVHLHTSVTDLEVAALPGDLTLDSDDLRVTEAKGPVRVTSHSKDIDLSQIYGDSTVEDRDGSISVEPAGAYGVDAKNGKGDVEVTLPPNASATVDGHTRNGDIISDFGLTISGAESKAVSGRIGSGASKIVLSAENGDVRIKKGPGFPAEGATAKSSAPKSQKTPMLKAPDLSQTPHLKTHDGDSAKPVTQ